MGKKRKADNKNKAGKVRNIRSGGGAAATKNNSPASVTGWYERARTFLKEVRIEFDKTTWSSKKETITMTAAVLALTLFFTAYLGLVDMGLSKLVGLLIY